MTFGVEFAKNVLSETRGNVDLAHIGPEWVYEFPTVRNWIAFEFLVEIDNERVLSLGDVDFLSIVSFGQRFSEKGVNLLRLFENLGWKENLFLRGLLLYHMVSSS